MIQFLWKKDLCLKKVSLEDYCDHLRILKSAIFCRWKERALCSSPLISQVVCKVTFIVIKSWKYNYKNMNMQHSPVAILSDFLANSRGSNNASTTI